MANVTYTVKWGDTLTAIAKKYNTTVSALTKLNNISNPNYIVVGQVLIVSGTANKVATNNTSKAIIQVFGLQSKTDRTVFATWSWDKSNTENYKVKWVYATGDGVGFIGNESEVTSKQSTYTAPENATHVAFYVKPISKKRKVNGKETSYWTAEWSTVKKYYFKNNPPETPSVPDVELQDMFLYIELNNVDSNTDTVEFQIVENNSRVFNTGKASVKTRHASYISPRLKTGNEYKVRCRGIRDGLYSEWSDYSANFSNGINYTDGIRILRATTSTSVYIRWGGSGLAGESEIEYTTDQRYFDTSPNNVKSVTIKNEWETANITGLESGREWFFRVRVKEGDDVSNWCPVKSIVLGKAPTAPTTWSSSTTVITGDDLTLYWVHNTQDGSKETYAMLELDIGGTVTTKVLQNVLDDDAEEEDEGAVQTRSYKIDTSGYTEGTKIRWRVKTRGIVDTYSDWSIQREINIYAPPALSLSVVDVNGKDIDVLESFPFYVSATAGPVTQTAIGYRLSIIANETYETTDNLGNEQIVKAGEEIYYKYFDTESLDAIAISASSVNLDNNISYTISCIVSMDSGLNASNFRDFTVAWSDVVYSLDAEISYDPDTFTTYVRPYCLNIEDNSLIDGVELSVYRREFDGTFTELATGIDNMSNTYVTDPHPSLDYARYRVVAIESETGAVSYYDVPGYPIAEKSIIIQWDEKWSNFDSVVSESIVEPAWSGSLLKLPYNIGVSDKYSPDVSLIEYIGRKHPVSYYGTQIGESSTWTVSIDKSDVETLYALRRLAVWMGDVYVREPSGSGYWANIKVSFSQKYRDLTIPVTLTVTRVSGGA